MDREGYEQWEDVKATAVVSLTGVEHTFGRTVVSCSGSGGRQTGS